MIASDLLDLATPAMLADTASFQNAIFGHLAAGQWEQEPLSLDAARRQQLLELLARWIAHEDADTGAGETRLMQARLPLRRLAMACGVLPSNLLGYALGMDDVFALFALSPGQRRKLALLGDATFYRGFTLAQWAEQEPRLALLFAAAAVDDSALDGQQADAMRRLIADIPALPPTILAPTALNLLQRACFMLGYQPSPLRYVAKAALAQQAAHLLAAMLAPVPAAPPQPRTRPRLVVMAEKLVPGHAFYRFFADLIGQLRSNFEVVLYTDEASRCDAHAALSDRQCYFAPNGAPIEGWRQDILGLAPDVIFYPSIGMSMLTFSMSLLRLASVQVASSGHPSPSGSREIDATLLFDGLPRPAAGQLPHPIYYHQHRFLPAAGSALFCPSARPGIRTICVNAMAAKLNADFLEIIRQIRQDCGVPTRLIMLPNVHGVEYTGLQARLQGLLGDVEVVPSSDHATYLNHLAQADVILQSFPFGGANTTIDGLDLGIPVVCLRGDSLSGLIDPMLLDHYRAGQWCADDVQAYARIAISLLQDGESAQRWRQARQPAATRAVTANGLETTPGAVLHAFWRLATAPAGGWA